jgi:uncharacterized membrane protein YhhN
MRVNATSLGIHAGSGTVVPLPWLLIAFFVSATLGMVADETGQQSLVYIFKPLTTALLFPIIGWPDSRLRRGIAVGMLLSLIGDVALMLKGDILVRVGVGAFFFAHVAYIVTFRRVAHFTRRTILTAAFVVPASVATVWACFAKASEQGRAVPLIVYATVLTLMVITAASTVGGPLRFARFAAVGAILFYLSDSSIALNQFAIAIPHSALLILGLYWLGQLGIAYAARGDGRDDVIQPTRSP